MEAYEFSIENFYTDKELVACIALCEMINETHIVRTRNPQACSFHKSRHQKCPINCVMRFNNPPKDDHRDFRSGK